MTPDQKVIERFRESFGDEKIYCCCSREYCYPGDQTYKIIEPIEQHLLTEIALARKEENDAWLNRERCTVCGKPKDGNELTDTCLQCFEEE